MRNAIISIAVVCCVTFAAANTTNALAVDQEGTASNATGAASLCPDKPNLTNITVSTGSVFLVEGGNPQSFADDVLMIDFDISADNASEVESPESRIGFSARVLSLDGKLAEKIDGTTTLYWTPPGGTEHAIASIMASKLSTLVQPSGELAGSIAFHATIDVDNEIIECNETDNEADYIHEINLTPGAI